MNITELDDRQIEILEKITTYINTNYELEAYYFNLLQLVFKDVFTDVTNLELRELLEYLPLLGIGIYDIEKGFYTPNRSALQRFLKNGGITSAIAKEKEKDQKINLKTELEIQNFRLQIEQLKFEKSQIDNKVEIANLTINSLNTQIEQLNFEKSQSDKKAEIATLTIENLKRQNKYIVLGFITTIITIMITILSNKEWFSEDTKEISQKIMQEKQTVPKQLKEDSLLLNADSLKTKNDTIQKND